jgi:DNA invertase Pin-like site-specific DNA recombinase
MVDGYVARAAKPGAGGRVAQQWQLERWVAGRGWRLGRVFEESDPDSCHPARTRERVLERVECKESDGVVVTELRQMGDSVDDALRAVERIIAAGGVFASIREGIDLSTPNGRLALRLLVSLAEW